MLAIGVSNFLERHLDRLLEFASITPHVNQVREAVKKQRVFYGQPDRKIPRFFTASLK